MAHHELWRDEVQAWLLARDSTSALDLLTRQKYEGHPALWQLLLLPLTRAFATPVAAQVLHLLIAATTVYLFVRFSPFTRLQRLLFSFGYFPFYEYAIISRNYGLCLLLLTVFCCLYPRRERHFIAMCVTLVLLGHTHALGLIVAAVLFAALILERLLPGPEKSRAAVPAAQFWIGLLLFVLGIVTAVRQIRPPADTGVAVGWQLGPSYNALRGAAKALVGAYLPVPEPSPQFWNRPFVAEFPSFLLNLPGYLAVTAYVIFVFAGLRRDRSAGLVFGAGTAALLAFYYTKYPGYARHHGFLFACLIVAAWMYHSNARVSAARLTGRGPDRWARAFALSLSALLGVHVVAAATAAVLEYGRPFSSAQAVTRYLHQNGHDHSILVGYPDYAASAVLATSVQREIYYPQSGKWGSYIIWNQARLHEPTEQDMIDAARALPRQPGQKLLLILNRELDDAIARRNRVTPLGKFTGAVVPDENFALYQLE